MEDFSCKLRELQCFDDVASYRRSILVSHHAAFKYLCLGYNLFKLEFELSHCELHTVVAAQIFLVRSL